ncbi:MAG: polyprenyl synthetase family protein [Myxococcota bacterium]|nr:polyprenyl synthetase family protein [Myxococcota bacterium]
MFSFDAWANSWRETFEEKLHTTFDDRFPTQLAQACAYPLKTGGKRIRPLFVFAGAESLGDFSQQGALNSALVVELIHTYSLVHDDLPCMDDDDVRRGQPTVHKKYGEAAALLVGDALLTEAFSILVENPHLPSVLPVIGQAAGLSGMIAGQSFDIGFEEPIDSIEKLSLLHKKKTGALIAASVQLGGIAADASEEQLRKLRAYGINVGLAFQLADDILDQEQDQKDDGPPSFVKFLGREKTLLEAQRYCQEAVTHIQDLPNPQALKALAEFSISRTH